jgi:hypothetical protein
MKKYVALLFCLAAAVTLRILFSRPPAQPQYAGKPLSYWLQEFHYGIKPSPQAVTAIREIGTNGIPIYLRILHAKGTPLTAWIHFRGDGSAVVERRLVVDPVWSIKEEFSGILGWAVLQPLGRRDANALRDDGLSAFYILGETGAPAVPGLSNLLFASDGYRWPATDPVFRSMHTSECLNWLRQLDAAYCLGHIGTAGRAALLQGLESSDAGIRSAAAHGLGLCRTYDPVIVGALVRHLDDANTSVRITVAWSLSLAAARFGGGTNATSVSALSPMVAPLMRCLFDTNRNLRCSALEALGNCRSADALPLIENLVTNGSLDSGRLEETARKALDRITEHPVRYSDRPPKAPSSP